MSIEANIIEELRLFSPISLSEMDSVRLMNRTDTKFVMKKSFFLEFLPLLKESYKILEIDNNRINSYKTLYFDLPNFQFFLDHHNGKGNRYKIRIRNYVESKLFFLEIKNKYKDRTIKDRIPVQDFEHILSEKSNQFIEEITDQKLSLEAKLWNQFNRITFVNFNEKERLTIDLGINFSWNENKKEYPSIIIAELKQEDQNRNSLFYSIMKKNLVRPNSVSKYCVGAISLYPELKNNNFKEKLLILDKLM